MIKKWKSINDPEETSIELADFKVQIKFLAKYFIWRILVNNVVSIQRE